MRQRKNRAFIYIKQHFIVWFRGEIKEKSFACQRQRNSDIDLNSLKPPNNCYFCKFIMFINALNPHKSSVINYLTSAPSSMPFISNFDFSYPKCHVFESHCRYQRFQSSWLLGWIFLLHKIARVCESLMFCGLWRRWRRAQPAFLFAFFDMPVQSARTTKRKIFKWLFLLFFTT